MIRVRLYDDLPRCEVLWNSLWPRKGLFDLWPVRNCFFRRFSRPLIFLTAEEGLRPVGFLPLCRLEEQGRQVFFPGETWREQTWLEQNRIPAASPAGRDALLEGLPGPLSLRYLTPRSLPPNRVREDETGYLFHPRRYGYSFDAYWRSFSGRSRKHLEEELRRLETRGTCLRHNDPEDLERLVELNLRTFGEDSYFRDPRFLGAFLDLAAWLRHRGLARLTSLRVGGRVAAVDLGGLFRGTLTVLAGGTDPEFPGVAKGMNLHHLRRACEERLREVDFLCGDFGWKERLHLTPRPLFRLDREPGDP